MDTQIHVELAGVHKRFGRIVALDGLDLRVQQGQLLALLGPNGAGKSTAVGIMLGLQRPDAGSARLFGSPPHTLAARRRIGVMVQEVALAPELRVREQIDMVASYYRAPRPIADVLHLTGLEPLADRPYGKLSGGQKRQVQFAMAICGRPELLFLDEPTVGLDVGARELMWTTLRRLVSEGVSVVLTTHYLEEAEALADGVAVIAKGRIIASGTVDQIRAIVSRKRVSCATALSTEQVAAWPGVDAASRDAQRLHITASDAVAVVRQLLAADAALGELEVVRATLADAFTELTREVA